MPQSYDALRDKFFMSDADDGIEKAVIILTECGYSIDKRGVITKPKQVSQKHTDGDIYDAIDFLINEWDYCMADDANCP